MYYSKIFARDMGNGPGWRVSLFVSGCRNRCKGCFNPETWSFTYGQEFTSETLQELVRLVGDPNISGLSILGGDPFEPENRLDVGYICKTMKDEYPDKDIWVWTGYLFEDLKDLPTMQYIDVLVDGRFEQDLRDLRLNYCGSSNQRVIDVNESLKSGKTALRG